MRDGELPSLFPFTPPLPLPLLRLPRRLLTCCAAGSASFQVVLGDFGCDVIVKLVAFGPKPPLVTRIARIGLGTRLLPVDMKDEYLIPGSGLESVAKIEYFSSEIE